MKLKLEIATESNLIIPDNTQDGKQVNGKNINDLYLIKNEKENGISIDVLGADLTTEEHTVVIKNKTTLQPHQCLQLAWMYCVFKTPEVVENENSEKFKSPKLDHKKSELDFGGDLYPHRSDRTWGHRHPYINILSYVVAFIVTLVATAYWAHILNRKMKAYAMVSGEDTTDNQMPT